MEMAAMSKSKSSEGKRKKSGASTENDKSGKSGPESSRLADSALQVWQAGLGALGLAQKEGAKLFKALIAEGGELDRKARKQASDGVDAIEQRLDQVRERASGLLGRVEKGFDDRLQSALTRFGVPTRQEVQELRSQLAALQKKETAKPATRKALAKAPAKRAATAKTKAKPADGGAG